MLCVGAAGILYASQACLDYQRGGALAQSSSAANHADSCLESRISSSPVRREAVKYALIMCPEDYRKVPESHAFDEGTRNAYLITIANIYHDLKKAGYRPENIEILYHDGTVDANEKRDSAKIRELDEEKHRIGMIMPATESNLDRALSRFKEAIEEDDQFTFVLMQHGIKEGKTSYVEYFDEEPEKAKRLYPKELLAKVSDLRAKEQLYLIDSCYSGCFGEILGSGSRVALASSSCSSPSIVSRADQFGRSVFNAISDKSADANDNGEVSVEEAFNYGETMRKPFLERHRKAGHLAFHPIGGFLGRAYNLEQGNFNLGKTGGETD